MFRSSAAPFIDRNLHSEGSQQCRERAGAARSQGFAFAEAGREILGTYGTFFGQLPQTVLRMSYTWIMLFTRNP